MKVALVGYAVENKAVYRYFVNQSVYPTIHDQNPDLELPEGSQGVLGVNYLENLDEYDVIVRSVGINPHVITDKNPSVKHKITTAINIFFEHCETPIIGVTGTKGKGTTSTLIHKILKGAGKKSILAGNIGNPMLDVLDEAKNCEYVVLELSSFQLYDCKYSPQTAVCLMVVPEHLDWHSDLEDYINAKRNIFRHQNCDNIAVYNNFSENSRKIATSSTALTRIAYGVPNHGEDTYGCAVYEKNGKLWYEGREIMEVSDVKLLGRHNLENVCAAIAATWNIIGGDIEAIKRVVTTFSGLEYRLEFIRELDGVKYFNDSFATTPETAIAALNSFEQPKVVILGGSDKGVPLDSLADSVTTSNVKHVLAIGNQGPVITKLLRDRGYRAVTEEGLDNMTSIVAKANQLADKGDVVLLSTGCASFGMFKNYKDRGDQFNRAVLAL